MDLAVFKNIGKIVQYGKRRAHNKQLYEDSFAFHQFRSRQLPDPAEHFFFVRLAFL